MHLKNPMRNNTIIRALRMRNLASEKSMDLSPVGILSK